jgi:hypothetical protein
MKYRYIIIDSDCNPYGINELTDEIIDNFDGFVTQVIDCAHGELLSNADPKEWDSIEEYK